MDAQNVIRSVPSFGTIVTLGALALSDGSAASVTHNFDKQSALAATATPFFFGEQLASSVGGEQKISPADCNKDADVELKTIFAGLVKNWREATGGYSLTMRRYAHTSYQSILALEPKKDVVSLILIELQQRPDRWFEALKALTKANPAQDAKTFDETVQRWIEWGKTEKHIS
jgi:hypothetical protein